MNVPTIETERLRLRTWKSTDLAPFTHLNTNPRVMEFFPSTFDIAQTQKIIQKQIDSFQTRGFGNWACEIKESGTFIGFVGLSLPSFESSFTPCVEIGWRLGFEHWGKGYAPEAAKSVLHFAFEQLNIPVGHKLRPHVLYRIQANA